MRFRGLAGPDETEFGPSIRKDLEMLLPGLLALAEVSRLLPESVPAVDARERWHEIAFEQAENVWVDLVLRLPGRPEATRKWLFDTREDVLLDGKVIRFDVRREHREHDRPPPLRAFVEALAAAIIGNPIIAGVWSQAVAAFEDGAREGRGPAAFRDYISKRGAERLEQAYARMLQPLSEAARRALWEKTNGALATIGSGLLGDGLDVEALRNLRPDALRTPPGGWGTRTDSYLTKLLEDVNWSPHERDFRPRVARRPYHAVRWEQWLGVERRLERIVRLASELEANEFGAPVGPPEELERMLDDAVDVALGYIAFEPAIFVFRWLLERAPRSTAERLPMEDEAALLEALPPLLSAFKPVEHLVDAAGAGCQRRALTLSGPVDAELGVQSAEMLAEQSIGRAESGRDAEDAFAEWVVSQTRGVLQHHGAGAWAALFEALRPTAKKARQRLEQARDEPQTLGEALHVSVYWGSAGYDFLGLEEDNGMPLGVRYEVKASRHPTGPLRVYVSANELAVFRRTRATTQSGRLPGAWKLIAVEPHGRAFDLTTLLEPLADDAAGPLARLATMGFTTDALILTVDRP